MQLAIGPPRALCYSIDICSAQGRRPGCGYGVAAGPVAAAALRGSVALTGGPGREAVKPLSLQLMTSRLSLIKLITRTYSVVVRLLTYNYCSCYLA